MNRNGNFFAKRIKSFEYAFKGFAFLLKNETNFKIQFTIAILAVILVFVCNISITEWAIQILAIGLVLVAEGLNTSIEKLCDFVHKEKHPKIGNIKDIAAASSLLASIVGLVIGALLYLPKLTTFL